MGGVRQEDRQTARLPQSPSHACMLSRVKNDACINHSYSTIPFFSSSIVHTLKSWTVRLMNLLETSNRQCKFMACD